MLDITQSVIIANAITQGLFRSNVKDFLLGTRDGKYVAGGDGSVRLTLPEIIKGATVSESWENIGIDTSQEIIMYNLKRNGAKMATTVILTPILFSMAKKVLRKPILTPTNRMLKQVGITGVKV